MTLSQKQQIFSDNIGTLLKHAKALGYGLTFGEAYRTTINAKINALPARSVLKAITPGGEVKFDELVGGSGIAESLHCKRLAVDFMLFINDIYQTDTGAYKLLGEYWCTLHPDNRWGGNFTKADGNHFSMDDGPGGASG